jgi:hypothetical protein
MVRPVAPLSVADLEVDALRPRVQLGAREVPLSPTEHVILYTLVSRAGEVVTYRELGSHLGSPKRRSTATGSRATSAPFAVSSGTTLIIRVTSKLSWESVMR